MSIENPVRERNGKCDIFPDLGFGISDLGLRPALYFINSFASLISHKISAGMLLRTASPLVFNPFSSYSFSLCPFPMCRDKLCLLSRWIGTSRVLRG